MSVLFVVAPAVIVSWPILCGAIAGTASLLGYKVLSAKKESFIEEVEDVSAEVELQGSEVIAEAMKRDSEFAITNGDVSAVFRRGIDGKCVVHVYLDRGRPRKNCRQLARRSWGMLPSNTRITKSYLS